MRNTEHCSITTPSPKLRQINAPKVLKKAEARRIKVVVLDDQNRVLRIKGNNRLVPSGGRIEWDDDDDEAAARRDVFKAANVALILLRPINILTTKDRQNEIVQTIVYAGRMLGEKQTSGTTAAS